MKKFEKTFYASWTDLDPNWHVANHAYIKYAADTRVSFFSLIKLNKDVFEKLRIGPVLFYEHIHYYKEILMEVEFRIDIEINGYSEDGRFFSLFQNWRGIFHCQRLAEDCFLVGHSQTWSGKAGLRPALF